MLFHYKVITDQGVSQEGEIDAVTAELAISSLQSRGLFVISVVYYESYVSTHAYRVLIKSVEYESR